MRSFRLSGRQHGKRSVLAGQIVAPVSEGFFVDQIFYLLFSAAATHRSPDCGHQHPAVRHPLYDDPVHCHGLFLVPGIVAMGIGLGAAYPDFKAENPTQTVTSFGGLIFMIVCAGYIGLIILIEAGPVYHLFMADFRGKTLSAAIWLWIIGSFATAFVFSLLAIALPMRFGENRLSKRLI